MSRGALWCWRLPPLATQHTQAYNTHTSTQHTHFVNQQALQGALEEAQREGRELAERLAGAQAEVRTFVITETSLEPR